MTELLTARWELVTSLSSAHFAVRNLGLKTVRGQVPISEAAVDVSPDGTPVALRALLDVGGVDTANARRDRDLRAPRLLSTQRFPTMTFTSRRAERDGDGWRLTGTLTARGVDLELVLTAAVDQRGEQVSVHAHTSFDRRDLGIRAPRLLIGHRIDVQIDAVLRPAR